MAVFVGIEELTPVESVSVQTIQINDEFNARYQSLLNRITWQLAENLQRTNRLTNLKTVGVLEASIAQTQIQNTALNEQMTRSNTLKISVDSRLALMTDTSGLSAVQTRQAAVQTFLSAYTPQPYNASLDQLGKLAKVNGRILGYRGNVWEYWSRARSDVFEVSVAGGSLFRGMGANSNPGFVVNTYHPSPLNTETFDLRNDATVLDGIRLPAKGITFFFGRQPLIADLATSEIWNASVGGRMNSGSSHVGFIGNPNRSNLWSGMTLAMAVGNYQSDGIFNYQLRVRLTDPSPTVSWTGGTFQGAGGDESYGSLFALRFSDVL